MMLRGQLIAKWKFFRVLNSRLGAFGILSLGSAGLELLDSIQMKRWTRYKELLLRGEAIFPSKKLGCLRLCKLWNPLSCCLRQMALHFPSSPREPVKTPTPTAKPNLGCFSSCISMKRMYSLWWDYVNFLWRKKKKEPTFKSTCNSGSHKFKRGKGRNKNPIIPELKTYGSVCERSLFCLLFATATGLIWSLH